MILIYVTNSEGISHLSSGVLLSLNMWTRWPCADTVKPVLTPIYSFISTLTGLIVTSMT